MMGRNIVVIASIAFLFLSMCALPVSAETGAIGELTSQVFTPVEDFVKKLGNIDIGIGDQNISNSDSSISKITESINFEWLKNAWNNMNDWFRRNVGISIADIIRVAVNFIIWAIELIVSLLKAGLEAIPI